MFLFSKSREQIESKMMKKCAKRKRFSPFCHLFFILLARRTVKRINFYGRSIDIYINPGDKEGFTFSPELLRKAKEVTDKAIKLRID